MKNTFVFYVVMALAVTLAACEKEYDPVDSQLFGHYPLYVEADAGVFRQEDGGTKATMDVVIRADWEAGDKVSVINVTRGKLLGGQLAASEDGASTAFTGTVTGTLATGDKLAYVYPAIDANAEEKDFTELVQDLSSQTYNASSRNVAFFGYAVDTYSSSSISKKIAFSLVTSYVHLNMSGLTPSTPVTSVSVSNINGGLKWAIEDGNFVVKPCMEGSSIAVSCTGVNSTSVSGNAIVHFAVPASEATDSRTLSVNGTKSATYTSAERKSACYYNQLYSNWTDKVTVTQSGSATSVEIDDPSIGNVSAVIDKEEAFVQDYQTEINLGGLGTVVFDSDATNQIRSNAVAESASSVFMKVENVSEQVSAPDNEIVYDFTLKTTDESGVELFSEAKAAGTARVTIPLPEATSVSGVAYLTGSSREEVGDFSFENGVVTFTVSHFSKYAIDFVVASDFVAKTGNRMYPTVTSAFAALQNGYTLTLLKDCATGSGFSTSEMLAIEAAGSIIDLNGKTLTVTDNFSFDIAADNVTVKNGTIRAGANGNNETGINSYAIVVGHKTEGQKVNGVVLQDLTISGGVSVGSDSESCNYKGSAAVTLRNCDATSGDFYCVFVQNSSDATIEGGRFMGACPGNCAAVGCDDNCTLVLKGGIYSSLSGYTVAPGYFLTDNTDPATLLGYPLAVAVVQKNVWTGTVYSVDSSFPASIGNLTVEKAQEYIDNIPSGVKSNITFDADNKIVELGSADAFAFINCLEQYFMAKNRIDMSDNGYGDPRLSPYWLSIDGPWTVRVTTDIDLCGKAWTPVVSGYAFYVDFDNHTVKNLSVSSSATSVGLFSDLYYGKNVVIDGASVSTDGTDANASIFAGCLNGWAKNVTVSNASLSGTKYTGAIGGYVHGNIEGCKVLGTSTSHVILTSTTKEIGSVAGICYAQAIKNCQIDYVDITGKEEVGGLVGRILDGDYTAHEVSDNSVTNFTLVATKNASPLTSIPTVGTSDNNYVGSLVGRDYQGSTTFSNNTTD